jgi:dolichyl-phosphate-mannose--protein O-mannosyl transferase
VGRFILAGISIVIGIILGLFVGVYLLFIGGILDIIEAIKVLVATQSIDEPLVINGILKIILASPVGYLAGYIPIIFGFSIFFKD